MPTYFDKTVAKKALAQSAAAGNWDQCLHLLDSAGPDSWFKEDVSGISPMKLSLKAIQEGKAFPDRSLLERLNTLEGSMEGFIVFQEAFLRDPNIGIPGKKAAWGALLAQLLPKEPSVSVCNGLLRCLETLNESAAWGLFKDSYAQELASRFQNHSLSDDWQEQAAFWQFVQPKDAQQWLEAISPAEWCYPVDVLLKTNSAMACACIKKIDPPLALAALLGICFGGQHSRWEALSNEQYWAGINLQAYSHIAPWIEELPHEDRQTLKVLAGIGLGLKEPVARWSSVSSLHEIVKGTKGLREPISALLNQCWADLDQEPLRGVESLLRGVIGKEMDAQKVQSTLQFRPSAEQNWVTPNQKSTDVFEALKDCLQAQSPELESVCHSAGRILGVRAAALQQEKKEFEAKQETGYGQKKWSDEKEKELPARIDDIVRLLWEQKDPHYLDVFLSSVLEVAGSPVLWESSGLPWRLCTRAFSQTSGSAQHWALLMKYCPLDARAEPSSDGIWIGSGALEMVTELIMMNARDRLDESDSLSPAEKKKGKAAFNEYDEVLAKIWKAWSSASPEFQQETRPKAPSFPKTETEPVFAQSWSAFITARAADGVHELSTQLLNLGNMRSSGGTFGSLEAGLAVLRALDSEAQKWYVECAPESFKTTVALRVRDNRRPEIVKVARLVSSELFQLGVLMNQEVFCAHLAAKSAAGLGERLSSNFFANKMDSYPVRNWIEEQCQVRDMMPLAAQELLFDAVKNPKTAPRCRSSFQDAWKAFLTLSATTRVANKSASWEAWAEMEPQECGKLDELFELGALSGLFCAYNGGLSGVDATALDQVKQVLDHWGIPIQAAADYKFGPLEHCVSVWCEKGELGTTEHQCFGADVAQKLVELGFNPTRKLAPNGKNALALAMGLERCEAPTKLINVLKKESRARKLWEPGNGEVLALCEVPGSLSPKLYQELTEEALSGLTADGMNCLARSSTRAPQRFQLALAAHPELAQIDEGLSLAGKAARDELSWGIVKQTQKACLTAQLPEGPDDPKIYAMRLAGLVARSSHWQLEEEVKKWLDLPIDFSVKLTQEEIFSADDEPLPFERKTVPTHLTCIEWFLEAAHNCVRGEEHGNLLRVLYSVYWMSERAQKTGNQQAVRTCAQGLETVLLEMKGTELGTQFQHKIPLEWRGRLESLLLLNTVECHSRAKKINSI